MPWVECERCGHVWQTKAKRPQCSVCRSINTHVVGEPKEPVDLQSAPVDSSTSIGLVDNQQPKSTNQQDNQPTNQQINSADESPTVDFDGAADEPADKSTVLIRPRLSVLTNQQDNQQPKSTARSTPINKSAPINTGALNGVLVALGVILLLGAAGYWLMSRRKHHKAPPNQQPKLTPW